MTIDSLSVVVYLFFSMSRVAVTFLRIAGKYKFSVFVGPRHPVTDRHGLSILGQSYMRVLIFLRQCRHISRFSSSTSDDVLMVAEFTLHIFLEEDLFLKSTKS